MFLRVLGSRTSSSSCRVDELGITCRRVQAQCQNSVHTTDKTTQISHASQKPNKRRLVDVGKDLATDVLPTGLLVVHDTSRGGEDDLAERTGREEEGNPVLDGVNGNVEAGRDDTSLVKTAVELDDNLAATVVVDNLELANVACCQGCTLGLAEDWSRDSNGGNIKEDVLPQSALPPRAVAMRPPAWREGLL